MKIVTVVGARPQFIKASPVSKAIKKHNSSNCRNPIHEILVHTGQHYDIEMSQVFFEELELPEPDYNLEVGSGSHAFQTGLMLQRLEEVYLKERPDLIMVYGDTNSTLAGALAGAKLQIPIAHVEAGLRSYNRRMPEELNRILTDHLSTFLFCPTDTAVKNLAKEGIRDNSRRLRTSSPPIKIVAKVGDVMYDALFFNIQLAQDRSMVLEQLKLEPKQYYLATVHRAKNTDNLNNIKSILGALKELDKVTIFPVHPRTKKVIDNFCSHLLTPSIKMINPITYLDMLWLEKNAGMIFTDSGGVQKEAYWLEIPCITLREETEWVETVEGRWNVLAGAQKEDILKAFEMIKKSEIQRREHSFLFDRGDAAKQIIDKIASFSPV